jgi:hypothetical protein
VTPPASVDWSQQVRLAGLRRFAAAITLLNVLGHTWLGFEQSWAQPLVALATAYLLELGLEWIDAHANSRRARFAGGGLVGTVDFLLSAHITGLAVSMLMYANERLAPIAFAVAVAIASKHVLRVAINGRSRHFMNPSNFGITVTLLLFPWVGVAPPYQFTENVVGLVDWLLPALIIVSGSFINAMFTKRLPLVAAWLGGFALQAALRHLVFGVALVPALLPMTGLAFVLYTFYMVTDPATTPADVRGQVVFGASVAAAYGLLMSVHIVFGLFFSLTLVCAVRGLALWATALATQTAPVIVGDPKPPAARWRSDSPSR